MNEKQFVDWLRGFTVEGVHHYNITPSTMGLFKRNTPIQ